MNVIATARVQPKINDFLEALAAAGAKPTVLPADSPAETALSRDPNATAILVYESPVDVVDDALGNALPPADALSRWQDDAEQLLRLYRHHRAQVRAVSLATVLADPAAVGRITGIAVSGSPAPTADLRPEEGFRLLVAREYVRQCDAARDAWSELEAATNPDLLQPLPELDCTAIWAQQNGLQEENDEILLQLHKVQEMLEEEYLSKRDTIEREGPRQQARIQELASYALELEKRYKRVLASRTWKLMAPIRVVGRFVKRIIRGKPVPRNRLPRRPWALTEMEGTR